MGKNSSSEEIDKYGRNQLINAVIDERFKDLKNLIKKEVNINHQDKNGWTALHFAAQSFNIDIIKFLLENSADPNIQERNGNTPMFTALFNSNGAPTDIFDIFMSKGVNPKAKNFHGVSCIDLANTVANYDLKKYFPKEFQK